KAIRNVVLRGSGYCSDSERHILFDRRMRFLGYFSNAEDSEKTQQLLNAQRERLVQRQRVHQAVPGSVSLIGYPFALACDQPHVDLPRAVGRMPGAEPDDLLWGTWDGLKVGTATAPAPLVHRIS